MQSNSFLTVATPQPPRGQTFTTGECIPPSSCVLCAGRRVRPEVPGANPVGRYLLGLSRAGCVLEALSPRVRQVLAECPPGRGGVPFYWDLTALCTRPPPRPPGLMESIQTRVLGGQAVAVEWWPGHCLLSSFPPTPHCGGVPRQPSLSPFHFWTLLSSRFRFRLTITEKDVWLSLVWLRR